MWQECSTGLTCVGSFWLQLCLVCVTGLACLPRYILTLSCLPERFFPFCLCFDVPLHAFQLPLFLNLVIRYENVLSSYSVPVWTFPCVFVPTFNELLEEASHKTVTTKLVPIRQCLVSPTKLRSATPLHSTANDTPVCNLARVTRVEDSGM